MRLIESDCLDLYHQAIYTPLLGFQRSIRFAHQIALMVGIYVFLISDEASSLSPK